MTAHFRDVHKVCNWHEKGSQKVYKALKEEVEIFIKQVQEVRPFLEIATLGARGFLREEPRSAISEARSGEERENRQEARKPLVAATVD